MTIKEIIENVKRYSIATNLNHSAFGIVPDLKGNIIRLEELLPDLEKANELQEEMAIKLVKLLKLHYNLIEMTHIKNSKYYNQYKDKFYTDFSEEIDIIEKYYCRSWEEIIK